MPWYHLVEGKKVEVTRENTHKNIRFFLNNRLKEGYTFVTVCGMRVYEYEDSKSKLPNGKTINCHTD